MFGDHWKKCWSQSRGMPLKRVIAICDIQNDNDINIIGLSVQLSKQTFLLIYLIDFGWYEEEALQIFAQITPWC